MRKTLLHMRKFLLGATAMTSLAIAPNAYAQAVGAQEADAMRAEIRALRERLEALETRLDGPQSPSSHQTGTSPGATNSVDHAILPPAQAAAASATPLAQATSTAPAGHADKTKISWKGSPQISEGDQNFKIKGRIQADAGYVSAPKGLNDRALGFSNEMRRIRFGGEGAFSSHFSYKLEVELSDNAVDLVDTFITFKDGPWQVQLGNQNAFWSLDELTGDTSGSTMERAAFTDAFNFERRLGLGAQYSKGPFIAQLGVFTDDISALANSSDGPNGGDENNSYSIDGRLVYAPKIGDLQLHFGGSAHWRRLGRLEDASTRYRQRPFIHSTNTRLIGTPSMNVATETMYGAEFAAISGRWHGAAEYYALRADRVGLSAVNFNGAYAEVGYFLTSGDSRGYKNGIFTNNVTAHPFGENGGIGSVQVNLRYDWLDLSDRDIRGGKQNGYIAALIWTPIQYLRFNFNYALLHYNDATPLLSGSRNYNANVFATRFELDF